jgi:RNA polymerase sigma-70 factor (ECF subfamily)
LDETDIAAEETSPADRLQQMLDHERLRRAQRCLTSEQQEVLALRFGEGLTARQTAGVVNKTVGAVEALQHRALAALRRILTGEKRADCVPRSRTAKGRATVSVRKTETKV